MRKAVLSVLLLVLLVLPLSASMVAINDPFQDVSDVFSSPARLIEESGATHFAFELSAGSAVDYLSYLVSPSSTLAWYSDELYDILMSGDEAFWSVYGGQLGTIFSFDDSQNLPSSDDIAQIRAYLKDSFANRFNESQKAAAVLNAATSTDLLSKGNGPELYSDAVLGLKLYGGEVFTNGFGWQVVGNVGFFGGENMFSGSSLLSVDMRGDVGYAFHVLSERLTIGVSLEAMAAMQTSLVNTNLLSARFNNEPATAFSENFKFGLGFSLNFGTMYRHNEELAFTLDLVNVASFRKYYDLTLTDFVDYDGFDEDEAVYFEPIDLVLRALWDRGPWHVEVEFGNVINQVVWMNEIDGYSYDFFAIPKVGFSYDFSEDLSLGARLGFSSLSVDLEWRNMEVSVSSALDKAAFGLTFGMHW